MKIGELIEILNMYNQGFEVIIEHGGLKECSEFTFHSFQKKNIQVFENRILISIFHNNKIEEKD